MDLLHLVDRLEELVASAQKMPIGSRAIVDRRRLLDIVDQMRIAVPREVREAQDMMVRREMLEREAEEEARLIVVRAEQEAARLAEDHAITEAARRRAEEIVASAEERLQERIDEANREIQDRLWESRGLAEQQMAAADAYAKELLERLERQLQAFVRSVHSGIEQLEQAQPSEPSPTPEDYERTASEQDVASPRQYSDEADYEATPAEGWERSRGTGPAAPPRPLGDGYEVDRPAGDSDEDAVAEQRDPPAPPSEPRGETDDPWRARASANPVPLRPAAVSRGELGLDNLLFRDNDSPPRAARHDPPPEAAGPDVIDDFDMPGLDDDPTQRRRPRDA